MKPSAVLETHPAEHSWQPVVHSQAISLLTQYPSIARREAAKLEFLLIVSCYFFRVGSKTNAVWSFRACIDTAVLRSYCSNRLIKKLHTNSVKHEHHFWNLTLFQNYTPISQGAFKSRILVLRMIYDASFESFQELTLFNSANILPL